MNIEAADILANAKVLYAIRQLVTTAAIDSGVAAAHAERIGLSVADRIAEGKPVPAAVELVHAFQKAADPAPWQTDVMRILGALGLGTHARPESCAMIVSREILPAIELLRFENNDLSRVPRP